MDDWTVGIIFSIWVAMILTVFFKRRILEHEGKIADERSRSFPNEGLIHHWEAEIKAWQEAIARKERRLRKRRRDNKPLSRNSQF